MTENRKTPKLRFKGFTDAWEQRKLGDVFKYEQPQTYIVENTEYDDKNKIPVLTAGQSFILGYTDEHFGIKEANQRNPVIIFDDFTTSSHYVDFPFKVKSSAIKLLTLSTTKDNVYCAYNVLKNISYLPVSHERHWISTFTKFDILLPKSVDEQELIGEYFKLLDKLITLHQRKLDRLKNIKKSMLDKMFPKDGEVVPEIRFKGFTDAWEQRKLSEVLSSYTDPVEIPRTGYERLGIRSHAKGTFHNFVPAGHELQTAQMHRVAADKFIVNITFGWEHAVAVTDENDAGKLVSHRFPQFSLSEELDPKFLKFIILDEDFRHHLWLASPGGAGRNRVLNINEMLQYEIMIPNVPEQRKIARMLIDLDNLITLHQRKLDKLKNIKKSMLDNMFV